MLSRSDTGHFYRLQDASDMSLVYLMGRKHSSRTDSAKKTFCNL